MSSCPLFRSATQRVRENYWQKRRRDWGKRGKRTPPMLSHFTVTQKKNKRLLAVSPSEDLPENH